MGLEHRNTLHMHVFHAHASIFIFRAAHVTTTFYRESVLEAATGSLSGREAHRKPMAKKVLRENVATTSPRSTSRISKGATKVRYISGVVESGAQHAHPLTRVQLSYLLVFFLCLLCHSLSPEQSSSGASFKPRPFPPWLSYHWKKTKLPPPPGQFSILDPWDRQ